MSVRFVEVKKSSKNKKYTVSFTADETKLLTRILTASSAIIPNEDLNLFNRILSAMFPVVQDIIKTKLTHLETQFANKSNKASKSSGLKQKKPSALSKDKTSKA